MCDLTLTWEGNGQGWFGKHTNTFCFNNKKLKHLFRKTVDVVDEGLDELKGHRKKTGFVAVCPSKNVYCEQRKRSHMAVVELPDTSVFIDEFSLAKMLKLKQGKATVEGFLEDLEVLDENTGETFMARVIVQLRVRRGETYAHSVKNSKKEARSSDMQEIGDRFNAMLQDKRDAYVSSDDDSIY
jgi:hypothetical protein